MKTKLFITLLLIQLTLNAYGQESATKEIKDKVTAIFNEWIKKGEFEKTTEYEDRMKNANEKLQEITHNVIDQTRNDYLNESFELKPISYNPDEENLLLLIDDPNENDDNKDSITIKTSTKIAKELKYKTNLYLYPTEVQIINDSWKIIKGIILNSSTRQINKIENEWFINEERAFNLKNQSQFNFNYRYYYYEWKITDQPTFNPSTIKPVTLNLED